MIAVLTVSELNSYQKIKLHTLKIYQKFIVLSTCTVFTIVLYVNFKFYLINLILITYSYSNF